MFYLVFSDIIAPEAAPTPAPTIVPVLPPIICPATAPTAAPVAICFSVRVHPANTIANTAAIKKSLFHFYPSFL